MSGVSGGAGAGGDFGRNEINLLLGGGLSERLLARRGAATTSSSHYPRFCLRCIRSFRPGSGSLASPNST
jgi:hypothetical protein